ncbi:ATP-binding protein [Nocardia sp. NPDC004722]
MGRRLNDGGDEAGVARKAFSARLTALFAAAGNPTLTKVANAAALRMRAARRPGPREEATPQRISDWRSGRNVPARFESFEPVMLALVSLVPRPTGESTAALLDPSMWRQTWRAASDEADSRKPGRTRVAADSRSTRPRATAVLRRDVTVLVGRDDDLERIAESGPSSSIVVVDGMAGVGKTALVTRAAHLLRRRYEDGCYFVELNAHAPGLLAASAFDVLGVLLNDVGIDSRSVPTTFEGRRDFWRAWSADRRVLLVLDDASDERQIEPLLPSGARCLTLISSRRRMIALDGAVHLSLNSLEPVAAQQLFYVCAGRKPTAADSAAIDEILRLCGYLPLAIVLVAGRLAHHPAWSISGLAAELVVAEDRLGELEAGHRAVRAGFTTSYLDLPDEQRRLLRWIGSAPAASLDVYAAAALADLPVPTARRQLDALYSAHLIDEIEAGRYRLHDLLREYARTLVGDDSIECREQAIARLLEYYMHGVETAWANQFRPTAYPLRALADHADFAGPTFSDQNQATAWMRVERANLLACLDYAELRRPAWFATMVETMSGWLEREGPRPLAEKLQTRAISIAAELGDHVGEAAGLINLGYTRSLTGDYRTTAIHYERALSLFTEVGDKVGEATAMLNLGATSWRTGHYDVSIQMCTAALTRFRELSDHFHEAVALVNLAIACWLAGDSELGIDLIRQSIQLRREIGDTAGEITGLTLVRMSRWITREYALIATLYEEFLELHRTTSSTGGQATSLTSLGVLHGRMGDYARAIGYLEQGLTRHQTIVSRIGEAFTLVNLGIVHRRIGESGIAAEYYQRAVRLYREYGDREGEATARLCIGVLHRDAAQFQTAGQLFDEARACFRELGNRHGESEALNEIGQLLTDTRQFSEALETFDEALTLATTIRSSFEQARALEGIGRSRASQGDTAAAAASLRAAVEIFEQVGAAPEATNARACLHKMSETA